MTKIVCNTFMGANSRFSPELLPTGYAVEATNVFTDTGSLNVWRGLSEITGTWNSKTGVLATLFLMDNSRWLAWSAGKVNVSMMQKASNIDWEVIYTGTGRPMYTNRLLAVAGGGTTYPMISYPLAIPTPTAALVAAATAKATPDNSVRLCYKVAGTESANTGNRIARTYVYTFVNDYGREGAPSPASNTVYTNDDEAVLLTNLPAIPQADINKIRIYVAASGGTYNYLREKPLPASSCTITDNKFGDPIQTTLYSPPPDTLIGITTMANGILAGYDGNELYFSEPYQSHAWPEDYKVSMDYPIKGLSAYGNMLFISTEGYPIIATGNHPSYMSFTKLGETQACKSVFSMVGVPGGAMYAARDGIVLLTAGSADMISEGIISKRIFHSLSPGTIHGYLFRGYYVGFYDSGSSDKIIAETGEKYPGKGAFILDPKRKTVTFTDTWCDCAFSDYVSGKLYLTRNISGVNHLYAFDEGSTNLQMTWETRPIITEKTHFTVGKVRAERYPFTFKLLADDEFVYTYTVTSEAAFRLPSGYNATKWAVKIQGDTIIDSITLAESMSELR